MPGIGNILALLGGAGQGYAQSQAQAPINAANNQAVQANDPANYAAILPVLQSPYGGGANASTPASPAPPAQGLPSSPVGGSILPMQPGQASVPMQRPPVQTAPSAAAPPPAAPPPQPQNAPVNQIANQSQANLNNSSLAALVPLLKNPQFQALTPIQKKMAVQAVMQLQQAQAQQQRQQLQDSLLQDRGDIDKATLQYMQSHGGQRPPTTPNPNAYGGGAGGAPTLDEGSIDMLADQYAKTGKLPAGLGYRMTADKRAIIERAKEKYPDVDLADAGASYAGEMSGSRAVGTSGSRIMLAANSLDQAIPLARQAVKGVDLSKYPSINAVENAVRSGTGDPNIVALNTALQTVVSDYSTLISRTGQSTDATRATAEGLVNKNMASGQLDAFFNQVEKEKTAQLKAVKQTKGQMGGGGEDSGESPAPVVLWNDLKE